MTNETKPVLTEHQLNDIWAKANNMTFGQMRDYARERGLIAPEPVDPLLVEAREICAKQAESNDLSGWAKGCRAGEHDDDDEIECALLALHRGMELAKPELTREQLSDAIVKVFGEGERGFAGVTPNNITALHAALTEGHRK